MSTKISEVVNHLDLYAFGVGAGGGVVLWLVLLLCRGGSDSSGPSSQTAVIPPGARVPGGGWLGWVGAAGVCW